MKLSEMFLTGHYDTDKYDLGYLTDFYDDLFLPRYQKPVKLLEIGVYKGGSIRLWLDYFSFDSNIFGADLDIPIHHPPAILVKGDAYSPAVVHSFTDNIFDFIIDDGPHTLSSQREAIRQYFDKLKPGGTLIVEDVLDGCHISILIDECIKAGYSKYETYPMSGKQKTFNMLAKWSRKPLFILKLIK